MQAVDVQGALLLALFTISHTLEHYLTERAQGDMSSLFDQVPARATLVQLRRDGSPDLAQESSVPTASLSIGQHVLVRPGEQVMAAHPCSTHDRPRAHDIYLREIQSQNSTCGHHLAFWTQLHFNMPFV